MNSNHCWFYCISLCLDEYKVETIKGAKVAWQVDPRFQDSSSEEEEEDAEGEEDAEEENDEKQEAAMVTTTE